jgi:hypothetical protein
MKWLWRALARNGEGMRIKIEQGKECRRPTNRKATDHSECKDPDHCVSRLGAFKFFTRFGFVWMLCDGPIECAGASRS